MDRSEAGASDGLGVVKDSVSASELSARLQVRRGQRGPAKFGGTDRELAAHTRLLLRDHRLRDQVADHNRRVRPVQDWPRALVRADEVYALARLGARAGFVRRAPVQLVSP